MPGPGRRVDIVLIELDAGEMPRRPARLLRPMRGGGGGGIGALRGDDIVQQAAPIERLERRRRQAAHPEGELLQRRMRVLRLLQHQDGQAGQAQLAGEEQADGPGSGNDGIMKGDMAVRHVLLPSRWFDRSVSRA